MKLIYVDEAGTSATEHIRVVVGIVLDADHQWRAAKTAIDLAFEKVPPRYRDGFIFHATDLVHSRKLRDGWSRPDREALLHQLIAIPRTLQLGISVGMVRQGSTKSVVPKNLTMSQFEHAIAFSYCISAADNSIQSLERSEEVAVVVAEDVPDMRKAIRETTDYLRTKPAILKPEYLFRSVQRMVLSSQRPMDAGHLHSEVSIDSVIDTVHFVDKSGAPLLQIADACAYGLRRYFAGQPSGKEYLKSMVGSDFEHIDDWDAGGARINFDFPKPGVLVGYKMRRKIPGA